MTHHLATAFVDFLLAIFALSNRAAPASKPMALVAFSVGLWSIELYILGTVTNPAYLDFLFHLTRWGLFMIPPSLALLTWYLIGKKSKLFYYSLVIPLFTVSISLCIANFFFFPSQLMEVIGGYQPVPDTIYYILNLLYVVSLLGCISVAISRFRVAVYREKQRIKWLLIVLFAMLYLGFAAMLLLHYPFYLKFVGATLNIMFIGVLFYATVQHRLMDIKLAIGVGAVKFAAVFMVLWAYFFIISISASPSNTPSHIIVMAIFIYLILEIYPRYRDWALPKTKKLVSTSNYDDKILKQNVRLMLEGSFDLSTFGRVLQYIFTENICLDGYTSLLVSNDSDKLTEERQLSTRSFTNLDRELGASLVQLCHENKNFLLADECSEEIRNVMELNGILGFFGVSHDNKVLAIVLLAKPRTAEEYSYEDIMIFDWLSSELGPILVRLRRVDGLSNDLNNANKTLSLLDLMNHYHHEIKAPLSVIDGVVSNNVYDNAKQREVILTQVERISKLIATMTSVFQGQRQRKEQPVALVELVKNCVSLFEGQINQIHYDIVDLPKIFGDKEDLTILFINLIKNAIEAVKSSGSVVLSIRSWLESDRLCLSIEDNGAGMTEDRISTLFAHAHTTKPNGSGIGLQAIKRIANEHKAEIEVKSDGNSGSIFILRFPAFAATFVPA